MKQNDSVVYLEGVRGVAAFGVFLNHFSLAFYNAYFTQKPAASHLNGYELDYGHTLYSFINNGGYCVAIFFVLSGFVLSRKYFRSNDVEVAISGLHRRFIRLYIPIAVTLIISYLLMTSHLYFNDAASHITLSDWFIKQWHFLEPEKRLWASLTYGTMFYGDASFDTCLWTISYEFYGSLFVYAFLVFTHYTNRYRILMMFLAMYYFYVTSSPFYMAFVLGMTLCYTERWIEKNRTNLTTVIALALLAASLMLGSGPFCSPSPDSWQDTIKTTIWDYTPWCLTVAAYFLVLAFILSPLLQKMLSIRPFRFLGYISFSLYLLHPLLLGSFSAWLFLQLHDTHGYNPSALIVFFSTIAILIPLSWIMAKYIDQFGIRLAKNLYEYVRKPFAEDKGKKPARSKNPV
jgi:peptidoglycan/LPS O-acetylase OafA/YrhL